MPCISVFIPRNKFYFENEMINYFENENKVVTIDLLDAILSSKSMNERRKYI